MPADQASRRPDGETELSPPELAWQALRQAMDPFGMLSAPWRAQLAWWTHPQDLLQQANESWREALALYEHGVQRLLGVQPDDPVAPKTEDERFADPAWLESAGFDILKEGFLSLDHRLRTLNYHAPGLSPHEQQQAHFWVHNWLNAIAPSNFFWTNPSAIQRARSMRSHTGRLLATRAPSRNIGR